MSRAPTSKRIGTPFISHSLNLNPGELLLQSTSMRTPSSIRSPKNKSTYSFIFKWSSSLLTIGITTVCIGAIFGGIRKPLSSPCVITTPPTNLVLTPQLVAYTYSS